MKMLTKDSAKRVGWMEMFQIKISKEAKIILQTLSFVNFVPLLKKYLLPFKWRKKSGASFGSRRIGRHNNLLNQLFV